MSVSNQTVFQNYVCNGAQVVFAIPFDFIDNDQVKVIVHDTVNNVRTVLVEVTDYTITVGPNVTTVATYSADFVLRVERSTAIIQDAEYIQDSAFPAETHEAALDKRCFIEQELNSKIGRSLLLSELADPNFDPTLPAMGPGELFVVNATETGFEVGPNLETLQDAADAAEASAAAAAADAAQAAQDAADAAASAAAAVGASVSNRIQVLPYAPAFLGALTEEEYEQEVYKLDIGLRITAFAKMSQYFIPGRPIKIGFCGYSTTADLSSKYKIQVTATLVKNGTEVTSTVNQVVMNDEVTVTAVVSALKVFSFEISADGNIDGVAVDANDAIILEFKRIDASANEDVALTRLIKQTFELSFA